MAKARSAASELVPVEELIRTVRDQRVILDSDLARLYGVTTKRLNEQVKRNRERFPDDFVFRLTTAEASKLLRSRSQIATLKRGQNIKYLPYAFTEHGAVMAANVLRSRRAAGAEGLLQNLRTVRPRAGCGGTASQSCEGMRGGKGMINSRFWSRL